MRHTIYLTTLLLAPLSALAGPNPISNSNIVSRNPTMKPLAGRSMHILARSPRSDDKDEVCTSDETRCGDACVPNTYTCCPDDVSGGCPADEKCKKNDGKYGCCPDGESCSWNKDDDDDDDDDGIFSNIKDFGEDVKDGWDDLVDNSGLSLKPELGTIMALAGVAAMVL